MSKIILLAKRLERKLRKLAWEDHLDGGLADEKVPEDFDKEQLDKGKEVEMEHTDDPEMAKEIAMDHLDEHPDYYVGLEHLEKMLEELEE